MTILSMNPLENKRRKNTKSGFEWPPMLLLFIVNKDKPNGWLVSKDKPKIGGGECLVEKHNGGQLRPPIFGLTTNFGSLPCAFVI